MIEIGSRAPDFSVKDQKGKKVRLSDFNGKRVLLSFRPLAWTPVCHDQMMLLEENHLLFDELNTVALGIGVDSVPSNKAWAEEMDIANTRLLSDFWPHGEVARAYGVFREADGFSERANIIIDGEQKVIFARVYPTSQLPDFDEVMEFLEGMGQS
ncbi:MAG: peroxiredoxin [Dehalococcoidia bacterium]